MDYFHGTEGQYAKAISQHKIDVSKGKGELGKGFYVGNQMHRAFAWAYHKDPVDYKVVEFTIDSESLLKLDICFLDRQYAEEQWEIMKSKGPEATEKYHHDAIWSSILGGNIDNMNQIKFESKKGESFINTTPAKIL